MSCRKFYFTPIVTFGDKGEGSGGGGEEGDGNCSPSII